MYVLLERKDETPVDWMPASWHALPEAGPWDEHVNLGSGYFCRWEPEAPG